ncbi:MAG: hypothetical protein KC493_03635 [Bacteriovoracaceae bacterium]|nr:hypothetical protein [Bacteriovoracaceae bacterium]
MKFISFFIIVLSFNVLALDKVEVQAELNLIKKDFKTYYLTNHNHNEDARILFNQNEDYVEQKNSWKKKLLFSGVLKAGIEENERVQDFIPSSNIIKNIFKMDDLQLNQGKVLEGPWSDDYWPIYKGILGSRYADNMFAYKDDWQEARDYVVDLSPGSIYESGDPERIDDLSPSEKYDLLFGDKSFSLTESNWSEGKYYYDRNGDVETWMGICHGWAPASYMVKRPINKVQVPAFDGELINFYPSDIKALSSLLWAKAKFPVKFLGGRCNQNDPAVDEDGIRIQDQECFDINPGAWHMSVLNMIGIKNKSFVFDATYDYQVWNQPVISYELSYFNPNNMEARDSLKEAVIKIEDFDKDVFKKYRSPDVRQVVGVFMNIEYGVEVEPRQREKDSPKHDRSHGADYVYDLELDSDGNIIGGEWYNIYHPDFVWNPSNGARALSVGDRYLSNSSWDGDKPVRKSWKKVYEYASRSGEPLAKIVDKLIELSRQGQ